MDEFVVDKDLLRKLEEIAGKLGLSVEKTIEILVDWYFVKEWLVNIIISLKVRGVKVELDDKTVQRLVRALALDIPDVIDLDGACLVVVPTGVNIAYLVPDFYEKRLNGKRLILVEKKSLPIVVLLSKSE